MLTTAEVDDGAGWLAVLVLLVLGPPALIEALVLLVYVCGIGREWKSGDY